jgi:ABC-2 type transport system permease protein
VTVVPATRAGSLPGTVAPTARAGSLVGTVALTRLALRRDRVRLAIWIVVLVALTLFSAQSVIGLYPDGEGLAEYKALAGSNQAVVAMGGPTHGIETIGGRIAFETWYVGIAAALMALFAVVRHTRGDEEAGRAEVVRATVVGRHAPSVAALAVGSLASLAVGAGSTASLLLLDLDPTGSVVLGASFAALGIVFAAIGLLAAQVVEHARAASGLAVAVLGASFVIRAVGDVAENGASWASPIGWMMATQPYAGDRWGPILLSLVVAGAVAAGALALEGRRDVGAGLVAPRPGPATATAGLGRPVGLAWRIQRGATAGWAAGIALGAIAMGSIADSADDFVGDNEGLEDYFAQVAGADLTDLYLATIVTYMALLVGGYAVQAVLRLRTEETAGRAEAVLATGTSRLRWAGGHLTIAIGGAAALLGLSGLGAGVAHALTTGDAGQVPRLLAAGLVPLPAVLVVIGAATLLWGVAPRATGAVWGLVAGCAVLAMFGAVLDLPQWVLDLSPFTHVPQVPAAPVDWLPIGVMTALGLALVGAGLWGLGRRDVGTA